jgi:glutamate-1-semialdehyde 2,1-aminomutase
MGTPDSPGVTKGTAQDTIIVPFNSVEAVEAAVLKNEGNIAALILEPVVGNMGTVTPVPGYLAGLRKICDRNGIVLIFDEVMTGFRLAQGGAQELYGVKPDLTTLGKIIGGGLPVGAYGGKREIMDVVSPSGPVYQAGTLSGNPLAMAAGMAMLRYLKGNAGVYPYLNDITSYITTGLRKQWQEAGFSYQINQVGSMFTLFFNSTPVVDFDTAKTSDTVKFGKYFQAMLSQGIYMAPSQYEAMFISTAINKQIADRILEANQKAIEAVNL